MNVTYHIHVDDINRFKAYLYTLEDIRIESEYRNSLSEFIKIEVSGAEEDIKANVEPYVNYLVENKYGFWHGWKAFGILVFLVVWMFIAMYNGFTGAWSIWIGLLSCIGGCVYAAYWHFNNVE